jgi:hypothetical protein
MRRHLLVMILATCAVITTGTTYAQSIPGFGSTSSGGGLSGLAGSASGLMGGLLPSVSSTSASNAAGVLSYCVKNKILGSTGATSILSGLSSQKGVMSSKEYAAGQNGQLIAGDGNAFSLEGVKDAIKSKICDLVLQRAQSLL